TTFSRDWSTDVCSSDLASPIDAKATVASSLVSTAAQTTMVTTTPTTMRKPTAARTPVAAEPRRQPSFSMNPQPPLIPFGLAVGEDRKSAESGKHGDCQQ